MKGDWANPPEFVVGRVLDYYVRPSFSAEAHAGATLRESGFPYGLRGGWVTQCGDRPIAMSSGLLRSRGIRSRARLAWSNGDNVSGFGPSHGSCSNNPNSEP